MILSVGTRTDIVNHYGDWLMERFREGYVYQRNPMFPNRVTRYELSPNKIDAIYFCSKNYSPFLGNAEKLANEYRTLFHYTVTAYGSDLEPNIPSVGKSVETLLQLAAVVGGKKVGWRYDPVLITPTYTPERHFETFDSIARTLGGRIGTCIIGFVEMRKNIRKNIPELVPLTLSEKEYMAENFAKIAKRYRISLQICRGDPRYKKFGIDSGGCVRLDILGKANNCEFREIKHKGNRRWCTCIESRDVGAYESCPNLCKYCFATTDPEAMQKNIAAHDPHSPLLIGRLKETDDLAQGSQESYLKNKTNQISLFD